MAKDRSGRQNANEAGQAHAIRQSRLEDDYRYLGLTEQLSAPLLSEILYAMYPPVHERRSPTFGSLTSVPFKETVDSIDFIQPPLPLYGRALPRLWTSVDRAVGRQMSDGYNTLLLVSDQNEVDVVRLDIGSDELAMVKLQRDFGYTSVQRTGTGKVKVFLPDEILTYEQNSWRIKPYSRSMSWPLRGLGDRSVAENLMTLAVHVLSPANVGATLVWRGAGHGSTRPDSDALGFSRATAIEPLPVTASSAASIRSICAQNDRALIVSPTGDVTDFGVEMRWLKAHNGHQTAGGTRHNSALKSSATDHSLIVFVVSEDGPVSVFHAGHKVVSFSEAEYARLCAICRGEGVVRTPVRGSLSLFEPDPPSSREQVRDEPSTCKKCAGDGRIWSSGPITPRRRTQNWSATERYRQTRLSTR